VRRVMFCSLQKPLKYYTEVYNTYQVVEVLITFINYFMQLGFSCNGETLANFVQRSEFRANYLCRLSSS
jgi:hypothetical protein